MQLTDCLVGAMYTYALTEKDETLTYILTYLGCGRG